MLAIHILAGFLALIAGAIALGAAKGSRLHRRSGRVFAHAMFAMTGAALIVALFERPNLGNVIAALATAYLVATGLATVIKPLAASRRLALALAALGCGAMALALVTSVHAFRFTGGDIDGVPAGAAFVFGLILVPALAGDLRVVRSGPLQGSKRIARHLWRMTLAMWIATGSFFLGQAKVMPAPLRHAMALRLLPVLLVLALLFYGWIRVRYPARARSGANSATGATALAGSASS